MLVADIFQKVETIELITYKSTNWEISTSSIT
ncbi:hypothetical protein ABH899_002886 [Paenibacillus sp. RC84]